MKPVAASPVLHHARALGRAFLGASRALRRLGTWLIVLACGVTFPWVAFQLQGLIVHSPARAVSDLLDNTARKVFPAATDAALFVLMIALFVPVLEGHRTINLGRLRRPAMRLLVAVAALTGLSVAWDIWLGLGWWDPFGRWLGGSAPDPFEIVARLCLAWVIASVIVAMREGGGGWNWRPRHLLVCATILIVGATLTRIVSLRIGELDLGPDEFLVSDWWLVPPVWWVSWTLAEALFSLVALEYLRIEPPHASAPDGTAP